MPLSPSTSAVAAAVRCTVMAGRAVHRAALDAADVLRQAEHAVRVGPDQVGLHHQRRDLGRVVVRQPGGGQGARGPGRQGRGRDLAAHRPSSRSGACSAATGRVSPVATRVRVAVADA